MKLFLFILYTRIIYFSKYMNIYMHIQWFEKTMNDIMISPLLSPFLPLLLPQQKIIIFLLTASLPIAFVLAFPADVESPDPVPFPS